MPILPDARQSFKLFRHYEPGRVVVKNEMTGEQRCKTAAEATRIAFSAIGQGAIKPANEWLQSFFHVRATSNAAGEISVVEPSTTSGASTRGLPTALAAWRQPYEAKYTQVTIQVQGEQDIVVKLKAQKVFSAIGSAWIFWQIRDVQARRAC